MGASRWLLDTNVLSELIRYPRGPLTDRIVAEPPEAIATSIIVACELRFGARRKGSPVLADRVEALLERLVVLPLDRGVDTHYADIRQALENAGTPIGGHDLLIAAHARSAGLTVVTRNLREFERVQGLNVVDWGRNSNT
jgi:tRNA(fMet)-specific endonuclease VapC